ncbi:hypothetical protein Tco_1303078 [Tanacetum coccineum]
MVDGYSDTLRELDSYSDMGRSSFARCLIKVNSKADLVEVVTIVIPSLTREDFTKESIRVEYEWRPSRVRYINDEGMEPMAAPSAQRRSYFCG